MSYNLERQVITITQFTRHNTKPIVSSDFAGAYHVSGYVINSLMSLLRTGVMT